MAVDTSAIVAVVQGEADAPRFARALAEASGCCLSAVSHLEAALVVTARKGAAALEDLDALVARAGIVVVPFDLRQAEIAREAFRRFGKGRHPAALNFGDCAAYALAADRDLPLLFKGSDFSQTDLRAVLSPEPLDTMH
ncbi:MAG: type II toxin-antitoxin system VapC family toxin [Magnetospirillum sp.]|nr:type II toxin-antitoxin system VapC family toxin [Magnetospirillum sp.]